MTKGQRALLPPEDEQKLQQIAAGGPESLRQRAKVILAWHEGLSVPETASRTKLSENQIRYMLRLYKQKGLDLFMVDTSPVAAAPTSEPPVEQEPEIPGAITIESLCAEYNVDMKHARHVATQARRLFDATMNVHRLPHPSRALLEAAALVHNLAYEIDQPNHHLRGRDIILERAIKGLTEDERRILACTTAFHRKKVRADREPTYNALSEESQYDALALSALLRVADGLDNSQTQTTEVTQVQVTPQEVVVSVEGPCATSDGTQSQKKADLWHEVFTTRFRITVPAAQPKELPAVPSISPAPVVLSLPDLSPKLESSMSIARAGRSFALHTLDRIDVLLTHIKAGDLSALPALVREASRLNSAISLADARDFRKETQWLLSTMEAARLTAAMAERAAAYADETQDVHSSAGENELAAAVSDRSLAWEAQARTMLESFDSKRYAKLVQELRLALTEDVDPNEKALVGFHVGPMLWDQLATVRHVMEHGNNVDDALNAVRTFQDHLVAFRDLLGHEAGQVLDMIASFEAYLSALQTTYNLYTSLEPPQPVKKGRKTITPPPEPALAALRAAQSEALDQLADGLPSAWAAVNNPVFRRAFALAVAAP